MSPRVLCVGSADHEHMFYDIAEKSEVELDLILEPCQKNTCAAIVASSIFLQKKYGKMNNGDSLVAFFLSSRPFFVRSTKFTKNYFESRIFYG